MHQRIVRRRSIGSNKQSERPRLDNIPSICNAAGVKVNGLQEHMTNHGMRPTMISILFGSGPSYSSILLRSGHTNVAPDSLPQPKQLGGVQTIY